MQQTHNNMRSIKDKLIPLKLGSSLSSSQDTQGMLGLQALLNITNMDMQ